MLAPHDKCTGCMACKNICERAIKIITDEEGFIRPIVSNEKCIKCGKCEKICPVLNPFLPERLDKPLVFACVHANETVRIQSASGGVFSVFAESILRQQGIVFGSAMIEGFVVKHITVDCEKDLHLLRKSKYIQSDIGSSFLIAKKYLENGQFVLFSGLPCQIAGLYSFLGRDYEKLYTIDIFCKGAPSPGVFMTFLHSMEKRYKSAIQSYSFREKIQGWGKAISVFNFKNGKQIKTPLSQTSLGSGFSTELFLRPSCYHCLYRTINRTGDISLGDFWGLGSDSSLYQEKRKGISIALLNSKKGEQFFKTVCGNMFFEERSLNEAIHNSSALRQRVKINHSRKLFYAVYKRYPGLALSLFTLFHRTAVWIRDRMKKTKN